MAKKKEVDKNIEEIKTKLDKSKAVLGANATIKKLRNDKISKIFVSSTVKESTKEDIVYYSGLNKIEVVELNYPNDELGALCRKPFSVSVIGILK